MAYEHYFSQEWKAIPNAVAETENRDGGFDCNICLDFAHEPVVTLCGHLYCWSCIYKWLHVQSASLAPDEPPQCPVCKDDISHTTMVPLYGRGYAPPHCDRDGKETTPQDISIPPRPPASGIQSLLATSPQSGQQQLPYRNPYQSQHFNALPYQEENGTSQMLNFGAFMTLGFPHLHVYGNSENSYHLMGSSTRPRLRRQEMMADKSLNRISFFLFCCFILCLVLF